MKWTLAKAKRFMELNAMGCEGKYRFRAYEIAAKLGCSTPAVFSMRRKVKRLAELGMEPIGESFALMLLVPEYFMRAHGLSEIGSYARREHVRVKRFVRRARVTGKVHLVGPYKRNFASNAAEVRE